MMHDTLRKIASADYDNWEALRLAYETAIFLAADRLEQLEKENEQLRKVPPS